MNNNCEHCIALWRDYAASTHTHFAIESKLQVAGLSHDHAAVKRLLPEAQAAAEGRSELRRQIREHEEAVHKTETLTAEERHGDAPENINPTNSIA